MTSRALVAASIALVVATVVAPAQELTIAGKEYRKLATRDETEQSMRAALTGVDVEWGGWECCGPFPMPGGSKAIESPLPPEADRADDGIAWRPLDPAASNQGGPEGFQTIDLNALSGAGKADQTAIYLRRTLTVRAPSKLRVKCGSDDGLRLWLDRELLVHAPLERGIDVDDHKLELHLSRGEHRLLAKVVQDKGGFSFALEPVIEFDRAAQSQLDWRLQLDFPEGEARHWRIASLPIPEWVALEAGGVDLLPDGRPIVCTRRGDVYIVDGADVVPPGECKLTLFASGLHEPLGIAVRPDARSKLGWCVILAQRGELTRLVDLDGGAADGSLAADLHETVCDAWQISGNYHEYAFGPRFDDDGNAWVTLNLAHTGGETVMGALVPTRGCAVRIAPDGRMEVVADGLRSPDGVNWIPGLGGLYTDNQGDYVATNKLSSLGIGSFHGHQSSLAQRAALSGPLARDAWKSGDPAPPRQEPAIWFPYARMGQSASDVVVDATRGRFGPFEGQLFVGDQTHATVMRVALERVDGALQGACFPFRTGFKSGVHRLCFAPDGSLYVGLTDRGWGARGGWRDGLERVLYTGIAPFEIRAIRAAPGGFELEFTAPVSASSADPAAFRVTSWTYEYHPAYGSDEFETATQRVTTARLVDPCRVHLAIDALRAGFVHEIACSGVRSAAGEPLLHDTGWYSLQRVPR